MNSFQGISSGQGLLKDYYDDEEAPSVDKMLKAIRKKRRKLGMAETDKPDEENDQQ